MKPKDTGKQWKCPCVWSIGGKKFYRKCLFWITFTLHGMNLVDKSRQTLQMFSKQHICSEFAHHKCSWELCFIFLCFWYKPKDISKFYLCTHELFHTDSPVILASYRGDRGDRITCIHQVWVYVSVFVEKIFLKENKNRMKDDGIAAHIMTKHMW